MITKSVVVIIIGSVAMPPGRDGVGSSVGVDFDIGVSVAAAVSMSCG